MATLAASPRRALTAEEKKERDNEFRIDLASFGELLKTLVSLSNALVALSSALGQAGKGAYLAFPNPEQPGRYIPFNRKHLRSAQALFNKSIMSLKNYLRVSKKKTRDPVKPESFSGTYTPVYAGEALQAFFTNGAAGFGPLRPKNAAQTGVAGPGLMDNLPMASQGYLLRNTSTMLFYIYAHAYVDPVTGRQGLQAADNAQYARSDDIMNAAFGGDIAASFLTYRGADGKPVKIAMAQAVADGIIPRPFNTYEVITSMYPPGTQSKKGIDVGFNPQRFNTYYYQNIAAANYYSKAALSADPNLVNAAQALSQADVRAAMLREHNLVKAVSEEWHELLEPGRKLQRDARKKQQDAAKKAAKAAALGQ